MGSISDPAANTITAQFVDSISDPTYGSITKSLAQQLISQALVDLNANGIVGSNPVTAWTNSGTGGSAYDLDVVVGTGANLTAISALGTTVVNSAGSAGLETTSGQTINSPGTVFVVGRFTDPSPSTTQGLFDARSNSGARWFIGTDGGVSDRFTIFQGLAGISTASPYDTSPHVFTARFNGDATSQIDISGLLSATGNAGSNNLDFGSAFTRFDGTLSAPSYIARLLVFDSALNDSEVAALQSYLQSLYAL